MQSLPSYIPSYTSYIPTYSTLQVRPWHPPMPYIAHKRIVAVIHTPVNTIYHTVVPMPIRIHTRIRPSVIRAELNRIRDRLRPSTVSYTEHFLNSKDSIGFDDEARDIRARANSLLRRIHVFIPRPSPSDYAEMIIPERMRNDDYVRRLLSARNNEKKVIDDMSWYLTPELRHMGDGTLACVKYVGGKPQSRRRPYYTVAELVPGDVKSDVKLLSFYLKNRQAAENATPELPLTDREKRKARALAASPPVQRPKKVVEPVVEPEPKTEPVIEPEPEAEVIPVEVEPQVIDQSVDEAVVEKKKEKKDKKLKEKEKQKEEEVRKRLDEEALRRAEEFLARQAEEARLEEERLKAAEEERLRLEKEAEEARLAMEKAAAERRRAEIIEQERLEAIRKMEEAKAEAARIEQEKIEAEERRLLNLRRIYADAIAATLAEEEERIQNKEVDEIRKQEEVDKVVDDYVNDDISISATVDQVHVEEEVVRELPVHENEEEPNVPQIDEQNYNEDEDVIENQNAERSAGEFTEQTGEQNIEQFAVVESGENFDRDEQFAIHDEEQFITETEHAELEDELEASENEALLVEEADIIDQEETDVAHVEEEEEDE